MRLSVQSSHFNFCRLQNIYNRKYGKKKNQGGKYSITPITLLLPSKEPTSHVTRVINTSQSAESLE